MSIASMTGFARAQGATELLGWVFELKSVNGRGLDGRFRLPAPYDALESELRSRLQKRIARGNVQIGLSVRATATGKTPRVNDAVFTAYAEAAERLAWSANLCAATVGELMRLPGVIEAGEVAAADDISETNRAAVLAGFESALEALVAARRGEGHALQQIIARLLDQMAERVTEAEQTDAVRLHSVRERLNAQVQALIETGAKLDPERLHQEAVLIATRMDVREEIDRLKAHVAQGRQLLSAHEPVGRKLDFLSQELVREANTLCAKANDIALTRLGLDLKAIVEQFREQVQNIE